MIEPHRALSSRVFSSLTTQLIALVVVSTVATALVVSAVAIHSNRQQLRDELGSRSRSELERAGLSVARWLTRRQHELEASLAALPSHTAPEVIRRELEALPFVAQVKRLQANLAPNARREDGARVVEATDGAMTLALIAERDGNVWQASLQLSALANVLTRTAPPAPHRLFLVDEAGTVLARNQSASSPGEKREATRFPRLLLDYPGAPVSYNQMSGEAIVGAARALVGAPALLVLETPQVFAYAPARRLIGRVFLADLFVMAILGLIAQRIALHTFGPIRALSQSARRISNGEMDVEIPERGGDDEIGVLTRSFHSMMARLRNNQLQIEATNEKLRNRNEELQTANEVLEQLSITDGLTHLHNHRYFQDQLTREIKIHDRNDLPLSILLVDLDNFKQLNDRYGHAVGDEILRHVAAVLNDSVRASDLLARYGGEEFVVLAANTPLDGALALAEKIRFAVDDAHFSQDAIESEIKDVSVSIGAAQYQGDRREFFDAADRALYRAKADGKNCVVSSEAD